MLPASIKIKKTEFNERFGNNRSYQLITILLPKAMKEFAMALPVRVSLTIDVLAKIIESMALTINTNDDRIDTPENYNVVQVLLNVPLDLNLATDVYLALDEGAYTLWPEDISAITATLTNKLKP